MPETVDDPNLQNVLNSLELDARSYFVSAGAVLSGRSPPGLWETPLPDRRDYYWSALPEAHRDVARRMVSRLVLFGGRLASVVKGAALTSEADRNDLRTAIKSMRAALLLREFYSSDPEVIHDEDRVLGIRPAAQSEISPSSPEDAQQRFVAEKEKVAAILDLAIASRGVGQGSGDSGGLAARIRPSTAFIMMSMNPSQPHLTDVADAVKQVFRAFDVSAVRADDIEHEGLITERILDEIRTAEFLFADLSDSRPNVYYEIGFAHALRRRVILFRSTGTGLHFDLAGYNCPEYTNLRDLREKLARRLEGMTNRRPRTAQ